MNNYLDLVYDVFVLWHSGVDDYEDIHVAVSLQFDRSNWSQCAEEQQHLHYHFQHVYTTEELDPRV